MPLRSMCRRHSFVGFSFLINYSLFYYYLPKHRQMYSSFLHPVQWMQKQVLLVSNSDPHRGSLAVTSTAVKVKSKQLHEKQLKLICYRLRFKSKGRSRFVMPVGICHTFGTQAFCRNFCLHNVGINVSLPSVGVRLRRNMSRHTAPKQIQGQHAVLSSQVLQPKQQQPLWANFALGTSPQLVPVVASATVFVTSGYRTFDRLPYSMLCFLQRN